MTDLLISNGWKVIDGKVDVLYSHPQHCGQISVSKEDGSITVYDGKTFSHANTISGALHIIESLNGSRLERAIANITALHAIRGCEHEYQQLVNSKTEEEFKQNLDIYSSAAMTSLGVGYTTASTMKEVD